MRFLSPVLFVLYILFFTLVVKYNTPQISVSAQQPTFGPTCAEGATPCPTNTPTSIPPTSAPTSTNAPTITKSPTVTPKPTLPRAGAAENTFFLLTGGAILLLGGVSLSFLITKNPKS